VLPIVQEIQRNGITSRAAIAAELNKRAVRTLAAERGLTSKLAPSSPARDKSSQLIVVMGPPAAMTSKLSLSIIAQRKIEIKNDVVVGSFLPDDVAFEH
jgi:hypothetical protein